MILNMYSNLASKRKVKKKEKPIKVWKREIFRDHCPITFCPLPQIQQWYYKLMMEVFHSPTPNWFLRMDKLSKSIWLYIHLFILFPPFNFRWSQKTPIVSNFDIISSFNILFYKTRKVESFRNVKFVSHFCWKKS